MRRNLKHQRTVDFARVKSAADIMESGVARNSKLWEFKRDGTLPNVFTCVFVA